MTTAAPLSALRVMPPRGAPLLRDGKPCVYMNHIRRNLHRICEAHGTVACGVDALALDLSIPTNDRIDGADVAARILAQAAGLDVSRGVCWSADRDDPLDRGRGAVVVRAATGSAIRRYSDPTDATDPRDILAAVLLAVLGVTP